MKFPNDRRGISLGTLAAVIAHSQIVVSAGGRPALELPPGFDETDISILDWIAAHGRGLGRNLRLM